MFIFTTRRQILLFATLIAMLSACNSEQGNDCPPIAYTDPTLTSFDVNTAVALEDPQATDFRVSSRPVELGEVVDASEVIINFSATIDYTITRIAAKISFSLFANAYACSPAIPPLERFIEYINITSDAEYSNAYPSGTSLNDLFQIEYFVNTDPTGQIFSALYNNPMISLDEFVDLRPRPAAYEFLQLIPSQNPTTEKNHTFSVEVRFTDGETFSFTLDPIAFN